MQGLRGRSSMVEPQPSKLVVRVRFPSPASGQHPIAGQSAVSFWKTQAMADSPRAPNLSLLAARRAFRRSGLQVQRLGRLNDRLVFVMGCPRSGTTFVGGTLGSLPGFVDLGEVEPLKAVVAQLIGLPDDEAARRIRRIVDRTRRLGLVGGLRAVEQTPGNVFVLALWGGRTLAHLLSTSFETAAMSSARYSTADGCARSAAVMTESASLWARSRDSGSSQSAARNFRKRVTPDGRPGRGGVTLRRFALRRWPSTRFGTSV
jgi:hypothetical protein